MDPDALWNYQPPENLLRDRVILVTGASDGIGRALAKACAALGATVVLLSRNLPKLERVYDEIEDAGHPQPAIFPMNLETATFKEYEDLAGALEREFGRLDGLVHNAGWTSGLTPIRQYEPDRWARVLTVNLHAPYLLTHVCLGLLDAADDPSVVFSLDRCTRAFWGAYGVAKAGLEALMRILAAEERGIRFNGVDTGPVRTRLRIENYPGTKPGDVPEPETVLAPYLYFLGPDSRGVSGRSIRTETSAGPA
jgi:NAD(P)-dependent dehydrogenase (short-subunit alcohol dehydrogenase family)